MSILFILSNNCITVSLKFSYSSVNCGVMKRARIPVCQPFFCFVYFYFMQNLIQNPTFDLYAGSYCQESMCLSTTLTGLNGKDPSVAIAPWTVTSQYKIFEINSQLLWPGYGHSKWSMDLSSNKSYTIGQTVSTKSGGNYKVSYFLRENTKCNPVLKSGFMRVAGIKESTFSVSGKEWQENLFQFVATSDTVLLEIGSTTPSGYVTTTFCCILSGQILTLLSRCGPVVGGVFMHLENRPSLQSASTIQQLQTAIPFLTQPDASSTLTDVPSALSTDQVTSITQTLQSDRSIVDSIEELYRTQETDLPVETQSSALPTQTDMSSRTNLMIGLVVAFVVAAVLGSVCIAAIYVVKRRRQQRINTMKHFDEVSVLWPE